MRVAPRRPLLIDGRLFIVAADHTARGMLGVAGDPFAMADRRRLLEHLLVVARATPASTACSAARTSSRSWRCSAHSTGKLAFGTMNRGGIMGARWELDDRMTAYDAARHRRRRPRRRKGPAAHRRRRRRHRADARGLRAGRLGARPPRPADHGRAAAVPRDRGRLGQAARRRRQAAPGRRGGCRHRRHDAVHLAEGPGRPDRAPDAVGARRCPRSSSAAPPVPTRRPTYALVGARP